MNQRAARKWKTEGSTLWVNAHILIFYDLRQNGLNRILIILLTDLSAVCCPNTVAASVFNSVKTPAGGLQRTGPHYTGVQSQDPV